MQNLRTRLPPANSLIAFEASARHSSFTRAAEELTISREAVSRHIRILEAHLGVKLFQRMHRAIALTKEGARFTSVVQKALGDIAASAESLRGVESRPRVVVSATIAISSFWLTPRLPLFRTAHPEAEIRVVVSDTPVQSITEPFDVALRYGNGIWPGFSATHLFDVTSRPVCTPDYLRDHGPVGSADDLKHHTLLNLDGPTHAVEDWSWWLQNHGVAADIPLNILGFDSYANVIQSALDGQGVALGFSGIIDQLLDQGGLVPLAGPALSRGQGVYVLTRTGRSLKTPARTFHDWVLSVPDAH